MNKKYLVFFRVEEFFKLQAVVFFICLFFLSCTSDLTNTGKENRFKHNFQQGTADNLYNISELLGADPVLESKEILFSSLIPEDSTKAPIASMKTTSAFPFLSSKGGYPKSLLKKGGLSGLLKIRTVEKGEKATVSFAQDNIYIDPKISFINEYEFLDYEILNPEKTNWHKYLAQLLGKIRKFKGFPNTDYYILPLFVGNYLVLYKVGSPDKIPYDELPLAKRIGDSLAVPLIGYPIKYCIAEVIPDSNDRETGQYKPKCEDIRLKYAEYIQLNEGAKQVFQYKTKPDLFPREFFTLKESERKKYNWFFVRTVVKSPENTIVGHQLFQPANLVEFHPAPGKLDVLDASGYDVKPEDKIRALFIPVEWTDYQIKRDSENLHPHFTEEIKKDIPDKDLRYFRVKFEDLVKNEIKYRGEKTLKDVFITDSYFSFNVEITKKNIGAYLVKFAFFKKSIEESANYVPKQWFETDSTLFFPSFAEKRKYYKTSLDYSHADHDRFLRTARFNPKAEEIVWYFSKQTPNDPENQWVRDMGHLALNLVNKALEIAGRDSGHKIKVTLDSSEDKEVGDIRYNILNLIVSEGKTESGQLGLGPNVANPITGEVVSATANVWVSNVLSRYIALVRKYIRFRVYPPAWKMKPFSEEVAVDLKQKINEKTPNCGDLYTKPLDVTPFFYERIQSDCKEVTRFIEEQQANKVTYDPENSDLSDKNIIKSCAKKLAFLPILGITLHEILHGFGQRHIFSASVDDENFYRNYTEIKKIFGNLVSDEIKKIFGDFVSNKGTGCHPQPPQYSSVMDYMDYLHNPVLFVPGKLDIAALRFIYFDRIEKKGGGFLHVPSGVDKDSNKPQKSILQTATDKGYLKENLKNYKILCGGEKIEGSYRRETNPNQPLCKQFDYGANPLEITINSILQTNSYLMNKRNRYDSDNVSSFKFIKRLYFINQAGDLYKKWKQYRDELLDQKGKSILDYSFVNPDHITQYKTVLKEEQAKSSDFKMYYDIRRPIFDYFKRLVFMPAKHCVYKNKVEGEFHYSAVALENILTEETGNYFRYSEHSNERFINCQSLAVKNWAKENEKEELVTEVGFLAYVKRYFLRPKNKYPYDEFPAFIILDEMVKDKGPFVDTVLEPDLGAEYYQELRAYMLQGMNLNPYIDEKVIQDPDIPRDSTNQINLNRVLSYRMDEKISKNLDGIMSDEGIFRRRFFILENAINQLKGWEESRKLERKFEWKHRALIDIGNTAESIETGSDYPFFTQAYEEYHNRTGKIWQDFLQRLIWDDIFNNESQDFSFASFIKYHSATLYNGIDSSFLVVPYLDEEENLPAQLFRRFNEFADCKKKQDRANVSCEDVEEKRVFMNTILAHYYEEFLKEPEEKK